MFAPTAYIRWAQKLYGKVEIDLASSGMTPVALAGLGDGRLDDAGSWERLRGGIARYNGVPEAEVLPTLGTTHALWTAYSSMLAPGDEALIERPTYEPLYRIAEGVGARVTRFERVADERFALDPGRVEAAITPRTKVVALTNLHNPGGVRASVASLRAIAQIAQKHGAHLLVDEVYGPFDAIGDPGARGDVWTGSARHIAPNVVVAASLTKVYGLGANRLGWMLASENVIARGEDALTSNFGHAPSAWSALGVTAFDRLPVLATRARGLLGKKRARVEAWVASRPHLQWSAPTEGLFGFAIDRRGGDLTEAIERAAHDAGVLVAAGSFFGVPNGFRLAWSLDDAKLDEGLRRLERALP